MKARVTTRLRLGRIHYLNTLPYYHGLDSLLEGSGFEIEWVSGPPTEINQKMREGELDVAPISSLEYLNHQDRYLLLPKLCIGSRDFSASVLLLSKERIEGLNGATISLTEESLSAAALLKILLKFKFNFVNKFVVEKSDPAKMLAKSQACLLIGDEALFFRSKDFIYKTDLSEIWWDWAGQPFCFGLWAVRREYGKDHPDETALFYRKLKLNLEKNLQDLEKLLREGLGLTFADEKFPTIFGYLFNLSYGLENGMEKGLDLFYQYAHRLKISPKPQKLEFIEI
ncbi:MAG: menaquinone biosynthesis protein [Candidatus Omnitrophica bacterium]|nr:menaquinone biosynthesis protein [Candidatus Omnitrophota bacterium]